MKKLFFYTNFFVFILLFLFLSVHAETGTSCELGAYYDEGAGACVISCGSLEQNVCESADVCAWDFYGGWCYNPLTKTATTNPCTSGSKWDPNTKSCVTNCSYYSDEWACKSFSECAWNYTTYVCAADVDGSGSSGSSGSGSSCPEGSYWDSHLNSCLLGCESRTDEASCTMESECMWDGASCYYSGYNGSGEGGGFSYGVPSAPADLSAAVVSNGYDVNLSWKDTSGVTNSFKVYRRAMPDGAWKFIATKPYSLHWYADLSVAAGVYEYHALACNSVGCSEKSNIVTVPVAVEPKPAGPVITDVRVKNIIGKGAQVVWKTDIQADSRVLYGIEKGFYPRYSGSRCDAGGLVTDHCVNIQDLASSTVYYYKVGSRDAAGNTMFVDGFYFTSASGTEKQTPADTEQQIDTSPPAKPAGLVAQDVSYSYITLLWKPSTDDTGVAQYNVHRDGVYEGTAYSTSYTSKHLVASTLYKFTVTAYDKIGNASLSSEPLRIVTAEAPVVTEEDKTEYTFLPPEEREFIPEEQVKTISGFATFPDGKPVTGAIAGAYNSASGLWTSKPVDTNGFYELLVSGGRWEVGIHPKDESSAGWSWKEIFPVVEFVPDKTPEKKSVSFMVNPASAKLVVITKNADGGVLSNVGVIADVVSAAQEYSQSSSFAQYRKTDSSGIAKFTVPFGKYYIRAFLPSASGFINPQEMPLSLTAEESKTVELVFKKKGVISQHNITGTTKLSDGTPTSAFLWGWSEAGGVIETRSSESGIFSVSLDARTKWHVGAGKERDGRAYKAAEVTIEASLDKTVDLVLLPLQGEPVLQQISKITAATEKNVTETRDGARVTLPAGSAATSGTVHVDIKPTVEAPSQPAARVVSTVYDVTVRDETGSAIRTLQNEAEIILPYNEQEIRAQGIDEKDIIPSYYDEETGVWVRLENYTVDTERNIVIGRVTHFTKFALIASNVDITPPVAPAQVTAQAVDNGVIQVTWFSAPDVHHSKVYRATTPNALGRIVASEVFAQSFRDTTDIQSGIVYYYTIRAVDAAGNESGSTAPAVVAALGSSPFQQSGIALALPPGQTIEALITRSLTVDDTGADVTALQQLLFDEGVYPEGLITGYFGSLTKAAVVRFQEKYAGEILLPVGLQRGTGFVGPSTRTKINQLLGGVALPGAALAPAAPAPFVSRVVSLLSRNLTVGSVGDDVTRLQQLLLAEQVYPEGLITGYFGSLTKAAVVRFQEKYAGEILLPVGLQRGTGFVGPSTRDKANSLLQ